MSNLLRLAFDTDRAARPGAAHTLTTLAKLAKRAVARRIAAIADHASACLPPALATDDRL